MNNLQDVWIQDVCRSCKCNLWSNKLYVHWNAGKVFSFVGKLEADDSQQSEIRVEIGSSAVFIPGMS